MTAQLASFDGEDHVHHVSSRAALQFGPAQREADMFASFDGDAYSAVEHSSTDHADIPMPPRLHVRRSSLSHLAPHAASSSAALAGAATATVSTTMSSTDDASASPKVALLAHHDRPPLAHAVNRHSMHSALQVMQQGHSPLQEGSS